LELLKLSSNANEGKPLAMGPLFNTTPAVQYLPHRATPAWRAKT
jgi:hypothetical protein